MELDSCSLGEEERLWLNMLDSLGRERLTVISSSSILRDACDSGAREERGRVPHSMGRMVPGMCPNLLSSALSLSCEPCLGLSSCSPLLTSGFGSLSSVNDFDSGCGENPPHPGSCSPDQLQDRGMDKQANPKVTTLLS